MDRIPTATGAFITPDELGYTLMHEHVFLISPGLLEGWPHAMDVEGEIDYSVKLLEEAYEAGVRTITDLTTPDLGRHPHLLARVAARTRVHITLATGVHMQPLGYTKRRKPEPVADLFIHDLTVGLAGAEGPTIGPSGNRLLAAVLKVASGPTITEQNAIHLRAIGMAHIATGAPIMTHSDAINGSGLGQQDVLESEGVDLRHVVIGHSGDTEDLDYLMKVMDRGSYIGMDRFGSRMAISAEARVRVVADLVKRGYVNQIVMAHDTICYRDDTPRHVFKERWPGWEFTLIPTQVVPALLETGVTQDDIDTMMIRNPARFFRESVAGKKA